MKTPDKIKKGLECCITDNCKKCPYYPLYEVFGCKLARAKDALTLIQQLEAERDAVVKDMTIAAVNACDVCKHNDLIINEAPCQSCMHIFKGRESKFEWRGVQKEDDA